MTLVFKGEIIHPNDTIPFESKRKINYNLNNTEGDVQLYIGEYLYNSAFYSACILNITKYYITSFTNDEKNPITASSLRFLFPLITKYIDPDARIAIIISANDWNSSFVNVKESLTEVNFNGTLSFAKIPSETDYIDFIVAKASFHLQSVTEIKNPFEINLDIKQLKIKAQEISLDTYDLTDLGDFNSLIGVLSGFIRNYLNTLYSGYKPQWLDLKFIRIDYNHTQLTELNHYYYLESTPIFTKKKSESQGWDFDRPNKPLTYHERVKSFASFIKLTPMYQSLLELRENQHLLRGFSYMGDRDSSSYHRHKDSDRQPKEREDKYSEYIQSMREL